MECIEDKDENEESEIHDIQFIIARTNPPKAFISAEESFDLITFLVEFFVVLPRLKAIALWWHHGSITQRNCQRPRFISFIRPIHQQCYYYLGMPKLLQQLSPFGRVARFTTWQKKPYSNLVIRGNHMKLCVPAAAGFANWLFSSFFNAPWASGWTLMLVLSRDTCSILIWIICSFCKAMKTRSKTPLFAHLFAFCPSVRFFVYRVPFAVFLRQAPPLATILGNIQNRVQKCQVFIYHVAALNRQQSGYYCNFFFC